MCKAVSPSPPRQKPGQNEKSLTEGVHDEEKGWTEAGEPGNPSAAEESALDEAADADPKRPRGLRLLRPSPTRPPPPPPMPQPNAPSPRLSDTVRTTLSSLRSEMSVVLRLLLKRRRLERRRRECVR